MEAQIDQHVTLRNVNEIGKETILKYGSKYKITAIADKLQSKNETGTWLLLVNTSVDKPIYSFWFKLENSGEIFAITLLEKYHGSRK